MPNKTLYVKEVDIPLWEEAEKLSRGRVSALVSDLLRGYVEERNRKEDMGMIDLDLGTPHAPQKVWFMGRWLVEPDQDGTRPDDPSGEDGFYYGVALTEHGNFAVYTDCVKPGYQAKLEPFPSLHAAAAEGVLPEEIYERAQAALDPDYAVYLDI